MAEKVLEITTPDLSLLTDAIEDNIGQLVQLVEQLPGDVRQSFLSTWAIIATNHPESADALRDLAEIILYYGKTPELVNLANIFKYIADSMDFVDESVHIVTEALFGMDEMENIRAQLSKSNVEWTVSEE